MSFADKVNYDKLFEELASPNNPGGPVLFSEAKKKRFIEICDEELRRCDGEKAIGTSGGVSIVNWIYMLLATVRNFIDGKEGEKFELANLSDRTGDAIDKAGEQGKLRMLHQATIGICTRFQEEGGEFAAVSDLVSGQSLGARPRDAKNSIFHQVGDTIELPPGTSVSLNRNRDGASRG